MILVLTWQPTPKIRNEQCCHGYNISIDTSKDKQLLFEIFCSPCFRSAEACSPRWTTQDASQASTWGCHVISWHVSNGIYFCRRNILRVLYPSANTCALRYQWFSYTTVIHCIDDNVFPAGKLKNVKLKNREKSFFIIINLTSAIPFTGSRERNKAVLDNSTVRNLLCSEFLWNRDFRSCPTGQALANLHGFISCCETGQNRDMGFGVSWNMRRLTWWSVSRKYLKQTFNSFDHSWPVCLQTSSTSVRVGTRAGRGGGKLVQAPALGNWPGWDVTHLSSAAHETWVVFWGTSWNSGRLPVQVNLHTGLAAVLDTNKKKRFDLSSDIQRRRAAGLQVWPRFKFIQR